MVAGPHHGKHEAVRMGRDSCGGRVSDGSDSPVGSGPEQLTYCHVCPDRLLVRQRPQGGRPLIQIMRATLHRPAAAALRHLGTARDEANVAVVAVLRL